MAYFGWQGFCIEHPEDWTPVALSGDRRTGYVRLASPRSLSLQVRWAPSGSENLEQALDRYLDLLSRDSRRKRVSFRSDRRSDSFGPRYRYGGDVEADGLLFSTRDGRVVFIEAVGESATSRRKAVERAHDSFSVDSERWAVLGLDIRIPAPLRVEGKEFVAGRTTLRLGARDVHVAAERWGLAESLLAQRVLLDWASSRLGRGWRLRAEELGIRGVRRTMFVREDALLIHQPHLNQITLVRTRSRKEEWSPQWDWLN